MADSSFVLFLVVLGSFSVLISAKCPCKDKSLCEPIARPQGKEFLMFSSKPNVWRKYDWDKVTTIALFRPWDDELMCEAHQKVSEELMSWRAFLLQLRIIDQDVTFRKLLYCFFFLRNLNKIVFKSPCEITSSYFI